MEVAIIFCVACDSVVRVNGRRNLEALKDDRAGQYSIRINNQWRICFVWTGNGAENVEIVDYY
jgi:proteic killer suppression protein